MVPFKRDQSYTETRPTLCGWYWFQEFSVEVRAGEPVRVPVGRTFIVEVVVMDGCSALYVRFNSKASTLYKIREKPLARMHGYWSGPIEQPLLPVPL